MAVQEFLNQFYALSGKTIAEKLKFLNYLINDVKSRCTQDEIDQFIANIEPKNAFEKLLKGRLIDAFRKFHGLVDVLKCDDRLFIKQVIGCDWFFEGSCIDFPSCEYFMTDVFPNTSFSTRNDIIHMLFLYMKDSHLAEQFFEAVRRQYGFQQAKPLLCNCSAQFIQSVLDSDNSEVQLIEKDVSLLCKRHPKLIKFNIEKKCFANHITIILKVMLMVDVNIFTELFESKDCEVSCEYLNIGRRVAKKIIHTNTDAVIKSAVKYVKILKPKYLHNYLTREEFSKFYISLFPESCDDPYFFYYNGNLYTLIDEFPPTKRLEMLLSSFEKVYGKSLLEQTDLVEEKLLTWLPTDKREKCAQQKIDKCLSKDEDETLWVCYLPTEKSIPVLKKYLIEAPDFSQRSRFISHLILTCNVNEDLDGLDYVCKLVVSRYRNDSFSLLFNFLNYLLQKFDFVKLGDRHWNSVLEVINIVFLNEDFHKNVELISDILAKLIHYRLDRNVDISKQIDQLIIVKSSMNSSVNNWIIFEKEPKFQEIIFKAFGERIPQVKKIEVPLTELVLSLLKSVAMWNRKNKLFLFSFSKFPWAVANLRKIVQDDTDEKKKKSVLDFLTYDLETKQLLFPHHMCGNKLEKNDIYFMKMDSDDFTKNAEKEVQFLLDNWTVKNKQLFRTWNLLSFTQVKETVVKICTRVVASDADTHKREKAIIVLSFLKDAEGFSKLITPFSPVTEKIAVNDDKTEELLPLIKTSAMCLHNVNPWYDLSTITQFCKGDYLKYTTGSLTSVCYNTSENRVVLFLERLTDSPVSVKKHAMRLTLNIVCNEHISCVIGKLWSSDKNPAVREILLKLMFDVFQKEPTCDMFRLLKFCISGLRVDDKNSFLEQSLRSVPDNFIAEYTELCWYKLNDLMEQGAKTKSNISLIVSDLPRIIMHLSSDFCDIVLKQYLSNGSSVDECINFAAVYLLHSKTQDVLNTRFYSILNLLKELLVADSSMWKSITEFFKVLCTESLCRDRKNINSEIVYRLLQKCEAIWPTLLSTIYSFETFVLLKFSTTYYSCAPEFDLQVFGKLSSVCGASLIEEFGLEVITVVCQIFRHLILDIRNKDKTSDSEEIPLKVIAGLLTEPTSKYAYVMAAYAIPDYFDCYNKQKDRYNDVIATIFRNKDRTVALIICSRPVFRNHFELLDHEVQLDSNTVTTVVSNKYRCTVI